jgi:hypothetical protein
MIQMDKNIAIVLVVAVVLMGFFALDNLTPKGTPSITPTTRAEETQTTVATTPAEGTPENVPLSELQVTACNAADRAQTCQTRLPKLVGLVTKEDCCRYLKKCC